MTHPIDVPLPPPELRAACRRGRLIPWVGSGLSSAVAGQRLPDYAGLILQLFDAARADGAVDGSLEDALCEALRRRDYKAAARELRRRLPGTVFTRLTRAILGRTDPRPSQHHVMLNLLGLRLFLTTNYDRILDQILIPQPEILTYRDYATVATVLDTEMQGEGRHPPIVMKLNGDVSAPSTIVLGQADQLGLFDAATDLGGGVRALLRQVMASCSILFLGYSFTDPDYRALLLELGDELGEAAQPHHALVPESEYERIEDREALVRRARIRVEPFRLQPQAADRDPYRAVWQFLSQLAPARPVDTRPGARGGSFFLTEERPAYLRLQHRFEQSAHAFRFITPGLTNALATPEYLEQVVPGTLAGFRQSVSAFESWRDEVSACMKMRMETLQRQAAAGREFRILCDRDETLRELAAGCPVTLARYRHVLAMLEDESLDVQLRFTGQSEESVSLKSYASLIRSNTRSSDVAVAYATQGTTPRYNTHVFEINTAFAAELLVTFEREWVRACPAAQARQLLQDHLTGGASTACEP